MTYHATACRNSEAVDWRRLKGEGAPERLPILAFFVYADIPWHKVKGCDNCGLVVRECAVAELHGSG
jgi:hypothetical protein